MIATMRGNIGRRPAPRPFGRAIGRRGIAEIGREQHEAVEQGAERPGGDAHAKPPPEEWPISVSRALG